MSKSEETKTNQANVEETDQVETNQANVEETDQVETKGKRKTVGLSREQLLALLDEKESEIERLASSKGKSMPTRVLELIESGYITIDALANELSTNNKNISSNLTYIRQELRKSGKWLISSTIDRKTYLKIMTFEELGWTELMN